ncbi:hypothetical protein [Liquorilactobacillus mali]|uniref:Uncharacterized protein n=1 Tax=Liquorilactobacillus mali KCTC 3596 = DSM 20444 TaxID=1046596 RepID=A0A0R2DZK2_9LACO|nr:hypothetical protein [Liquorilactobacillus mali]KRN09353.1 hypothetical protein FD00_GL001076 [Liquorilactobacillus mali KCTC 3596 = DSM 20444]
MVIISLILLGILIYTNITGICGLFRSEEKIKGRLKDLNDDNYKSMDCMAGCFGMLMYIPALLIAIFCVGDNVSILLLIIIVVGEFIEGNIRISIVNRVDNKDGYLKYLFKERYKLQYILFEIYELIVFVYVFVELFFKL